MRSKTRSALKLLVPAILVGFALELWYVGALPRSMDSQQTLIFSSERFVPGTEASLRLLVNDVGMDKPVEGAAVTMSLRADASDDGILLFEGVSDAAGNVPVSFRVPAEASGAHQLILEVESDAGRDRIELQIQIEPHFRLSLATDKPLYQPGQTIHMRALAFRSFDVTAARDATIDFLVRDPKGNRVFRKSVNASEFGVGAADFDLAEAAAHGAYELSASLGESRTVTTVEVRPYVLPKFRILLSTDRSFYAPGQRVEGTLEATYFFGKPVARARVQLEAVRYGAKRTAIVDLHGRTNAKGVYRFGFDFPQAVVGSESPSDSREAVLEATVIDQTEHTEQTVAPLLVSDQAIAIEAVALSGRLWQGVENEILVRTTYPDGAPAQTDLEIDADFDFHRSLSTSPLGVAVLRIEPPHRFSELTIEAHDGRGATAKRKIAFRIENGALALRTDRAVYFTGETMNLTIRAKYDGTVYVDIVKDGQTVGTYSAGAKLAVDVSSDWYGTMEVHAYMITPERIVHDSRVIVVDRANDLGVDVAADKDAYRPGASAAIELRTTSRSHDLPVQTALGLSIVDESVFAGKDWAPGAAKLPFLLDTRLLQRARKTQGFRLPSIDAGAQEHRRVQDAIAKALWTDVYGIGLAMRVDTYEEKKEAITQAQANGLGLLAGMVLLGVAVTLLGVWWTVISDLRGSGVVLRSLVGTANWAACWCWRRLRFFLFGEFAMEMPFALTLPVGFVLVSIALAVYARKRETEPIRALSLLMGGVSAWCLLFLLLAFAGGHWVHRDPPFTPVLESILEPFMVLATVTPLALILYGQKMWAESRRAAGWLVVLLGSFPLLVIPGSFLAEITEGLSNQMVFHLIVPDTPAESSSGATPLESETPPVRQHFPETLYWNPELVTDASGTARIEIPMADNITTWRLTALATSADGRLGVTTYQIPVFQDFFVNVELPRALTQGDEVHVPVSVFNYRQEAQQVRLSLDPQSWFEPLGSSERTLTLKANDVGVVHFPIRARELGRQRFQVTARGPKASDAVARELQVLPQGKEVRGTESDWLDQDRTIAITVPPDAIPGTSRAEVKIYPGPLAQGVEGLEKILRLPHG